MAIVDKKKQVFGKIAAFRTLTSGLPTLKKTSSFPSINNNGNTVLFLTDLIKALVGYEALASSVNDTIIHELPKIEKIVKNALRLELKSFVSCGVDPSLPSWIKSTGSGIVLPVSKLDFMNILKTNPNSYGGKLTYTDITPILTDSNDFNTFLYGVIQNDNITYSWKNIIDITFHSVGTGNNPNNTLTIKANPNYDNKTLTDLNDDFINSLSLFNTENIVNKIVDINYGSVSSIVGKTLNQLQSEAKINNIIDKMVNNVNKTPLNDSAFSFTKEENYRHELEALNRKKGSVDLKTTTTIPSKVPASFLTQLSTDLNGAILPADKKLVLTNGLNKMANASVSGVLNQTDAATAKLNFIQRIIDSIIKSIVSIILSPKVLTIFILNYKLVYGQTADFSDPIDFIKKNKQLMNNIMKTIGEEIIKILLAIALKQISQLMAEAFIKRQKEKSVARLAQLESLAGVPSNEINKLFNSL
jgi:hypothetical protein